MHHGCVAGHGGQYRLQLRAVHRVAARCGSRSRRLRLAHCDGRATQAGHQGTYPHQVGLPKLGIKVCTLTGYQGVYPHQVGLPKLGIKGCTLTGWEGNPSWASRYVPWVGLPKLGIKVHTFTWWGYPSLASRYVPSHGGATQAEHQGMYSHMVGLPKIGIKVHTLTGWGATQAGHQGTYSQATQTGHQGMYPPWVGLLKLSIKVHTLRLPKLGIKVCTLTGWGCPSWPSRYDFSQTRTLRPLRFNEMRVV